MLIQQVHKVTKVIFTNPALYLKHLTKKNKAPRQIHNSVLWIFIAHIVNILSKMALRQDQSHYNNEMKS